MGVTIASVMVSQRDRMRPYLDVVLSCSHPWNLAWIDVLQQGIRVEADVRRTKRRFPTDGPGVLAYGPMADFLRSAEELVASTGLRKRRWMQSRAQAK